MNQNEWEIRESQRLRELEEYRGRTAQMEKVRKTKKIVRRINENFSISDNEMVERMHK